MTELLLVRHGQAPHNLDGRWEGWAYALENASLTQVRVGAGGNVLVALNDRLHLGGRRQDE
jgi:hypothetical protein